MTTAELKGYRDSLIRQVLGHSLAAVEADEGGWAADRFDAISRLDWDLMEADETHRPFCWARYRARLERAGKPGSFRPADRYRRRAA